MNSFTKNARNGCNDPGGSESDACDVRDDAKGFVYFVWSPTEP